ncbi:MAG: acyl-CoA thioesterase [Candidatus Schekmanbacteria bacterium]|nr:acyl-CoA thioesterase [Candidatus Schekmanbacteria bacterium]
MAGDCSEGAPGSPRPLFIHRQTVRFPDVDHAGIAFFGVFFTYCHNAQEEWLAAIGYPLPELLTGRGTGLPVVRVECDFASPARHGDVLRIDVFAERTGAKSITFRYELTNETEARAVGVVRITQVAVKMQEMRAIPIPDFLRAALVTAARETS